MIFLWATLGLLGLVLAKQPNILFIITDDQDLHMTPTEVMPLLHVRYSWYMARPWEIVS